MLGKWRTILVPALTVVLLVVGLAVGCVVTPTPPVPTEEPATVTPTPSSTPSPSMVEEIDCDALSEDEAYGLYLMPGQVIVIAPAEVLENPGPFFQELGVDLAPIEGEDLVRLDYLAPLLEEQREFLPFLPEPVRAEPAMRLLQIESGQSVAQAVCQINQQGAELGALADPNYLTSPYQPGNAIGSPLAGKGPDDVQPGLFGDQWAFQQIRIGASQGPRPQSGEGRGVRVGVFDTAPKPVQQLEEMPVRTVAGVALSVGNLNVDWATPALDLTLWDPPQPVMPAAAPVSALGVTPDLSDHGLFVAGLIHGVAPASDIHLIRVLEDHGVGDLNTLNKALGAFIAKMDEDSDQLAGTVINLSLGIEQPRELRKADPRVESLLIPLLAAYHDGAVIVAASGNESDGEVLAPQIPAAFPETIAVAASNVSRTRACFSNYGLVAAPGGDGGPRPASTPDVCVPRVDECKSDSGNCEFGVISLVLNTAAGGTSPTGYAYWSGTSFAAPLVSGLAALVLEQNAGSSPADVANAITGGVCPPSPPTDPFLGYGIIDVPHTLGSDCPTPTPPP